MNRDVFYIVFLTDKYNIFFLALDISGDCKTNNPTLIVTTKPEFYITDMQLAETCLGNNKRFILRAKEGQVLNISEVNLQNSFIGDGTYGTLKDLSNNKLEIIADGPREKHLLLSSSNEVELTITDNAASNNRFMLHVSGKCNRVNLYTFVKFNR